MWTWMPPVLFLVSVKCLLGLIPHGDHNMVDVSPRGNPCKPLWNKKSTSWISKKGTKKRKKSTKFAVPCLFYNSSRLLSLDRLSSLMATAQGLIFKLPQDPVAPINEATRWAREARGEHNASRWVVLTDSVLRAKYGEPVQSDFGDKKKIS